MSEPGPSSRRAGRPPSAARFVALLAGAWISSWACAPPSTLPAPIPLAKGTGVELGAGVTVSLANGEDCRIAADAALDTRSPYTPTCTPTTLALPDIAHWGMVPVSDRWAVGWQLSAGAGTPGIAGGVAARYDFTRSERMLIGPQLEAGVAWGAIGLPASIRVGDRLWLYTHPSVGYRLNGLGRVPIGMGMPIGKRLRLDVEGGYAVPVMHGLYTRYDAVYGGRSWVSAGLSTRVGG